MHLPLKAVSGQWSGESRHHPDEIFTQGSRAFLPPLLTPASCPAFCPDVRRGRRGPRCTAPSAAHHRSPQTGKSHPTQTPLCSGGEQRHRHPLFLPRLGSLGFAPLWHIRARRAQPDLSPCSCRLLRPSAGPCPRHPTSPRAPTARAIEKAACSSYLQRVGEEPQRLPEGKAMP